MGKTNKGNKGNKGGSKDKHDRSKKYKQRANDNDEAKFHVMLLESKLRCKTISSDGNCLFRAIGDQVYGDSNKYQSLRDSVVAYMKQHEEYFTSFIEDDEKFDDYVEKMSKDGEWGSEIELVILSRILVVDIIVHQVDGPRYVIKYESSEGIDSACLNKNTKQIPREAHISYHGACHYNSIRMIDDDDDRPAVEYHTKNSHTQCNDLVKDVMNAVSWSTKRYAEIALEMSSGDVDAAIDLLFTNTTIITKIINKNNNDSNNENNNDNDSNNKNNNENNNDNDNDNENDNDNHNDTKSTKNKTHNKIMMRKVKAPILSKKELRKMKKKGTCLANNVGSSLNNDINDSLVKAVSEIYL